MTSTGISRSMSSISSIVSLILNLYSSYKISTESLLAFLHNPSYMLSQLIFGIVFASRITFLDSVKFFTVSIIIIRETFGME